MKKNLFLTIIIGYATLLSTGVNAAEIEDTYPLNLSAKADVIAHHCKRWDNRYLDLESPSFKKACDSYITRSAYMAASLGGITSAAYFYYNNPKFSIIQNPLDLAKIATLTGLSYWAGKKYAENQVNNLANKKKLETLVDLNNDLVFTSDEALGFNARDIENRLYDENPKSLGLVARKKYLLELFNERTGNLFPIYNMYHANAYRVGPVDNKTLKQTEAAMDLARKKCEESARLKSQLETTLKDIKMTNSLFSIIRDSEFERRINSNLLSCDSSELYLNMQEWLTFIKEQNSSK